MPGPPLQKSLHRFKRRRALPLLMITTAAAAAAVVTANASSAGAAPSTRTNRTQQAADFTACMRSHGVADFPGVTVTADGRVTLKPGEERVDVFSATYRDAAQACASHLPKGSALPTPPRPPSMAGRDSVTPAVPVEPPSVACTAGCPPHPGAPAVPASPTWPR